jgi:uncharacterized protein
MSHAFAQLTRILVYPIKACAAVELTESPLVERGLAFDRRYMLVDQRGTFVTQREVPELCLVRTAFEADALVVDAPRRQRLALPLEPTSGESQEYRIWEDVGRGIRSDDGSRWFSELLGHSVSLVYMPDGERRAVNPKRARPHDVVSFADAYPLLVISEASLADLNHRLAAPVSMSRFRPNLVIAGCEPYAEDRLTTLEIGGISLRAVKRCERCVVTTVDQDTAAQGREPLTTLARYRRHEGKVWFGMNLIHDSAGTLRVGDLVHVP